MTIKARLRCNKTYRYHACAVHKTNIYIAHEPRYSCPVPIFENITFICSRMSLLTSRIACSIWKRAGILHYAALMIQKHAAAHSCTPTHTVVHTAQVPVPLLCLWIRGPEYCGFSTGSCPICIILADPNPWYILYRTFSWYRYTMTNSVLYDLRWKWIIFSFKRAVPGSASHQISGSKSA